MDKAKNIIKVIIVIVLSSLSIIFIPRLLSSVGYIAMLVVPEVVILLVVLAAIAIEYRGKFVQGLNENIPIKMFTPRELFGSILFFVGMYFITNGVAYISSLIPGFDVNSEYDFYAFLFEKYSPLVIILIMCVLPAICEEVLFRGYVLTSLKSKKLPMVPLIVVSLLFGAMHFDITKLLTTAVLGFGLCYIAYRTGSIALSVLLHMANNIYSMIMISTILKAPTIEGEVDPMIYITFVVSSLVFGTLLTIAGLKTFPPKKSEDI